MIHSKYCKPRVFPWNNDRTPEQIDRCQELGGDLSLNREKTYEIGRDGVLGYNKNTPSLSLSLRQYEFGSMAFWYDLANFETPASGADHYIDLDDIKTTQCDIAAFLTDDSNTFVGSIWLPKLRVNGFSLNIGDPDAILERNFDLIGEDYKLLDGKYFAFQKATAGAPGALTMTLSPVAVEWASGDYVFRVLRVRAGVVSELLEDTVVAYANDTWRYSAGDVIVQSCLTSDIVKVYYESSTAYATTWTDNNVDSDFLKAEACEIYMKVGTGTRIYKLQTVGIDVSFERTDYKEIGNSEVVQRGVKSKTVAISLDRFAEDQILEDILAGDTTYPYIDPRDFSETIQVMVKVFSDKTHTTFKMGYLMSNATPTSVNFSQPIEDYHKRTSTLECDNLKISNEESEIVFL